MAQGQNASRPSQCKDLWKPGPLSRSSHSASNKRLNRRMERHINKQEMKRQQNVNGDTK